MHLVCVLGRRDFFGPLNLGAYVRPSRAAFFAWYLRSRPRFVSAFHSALVRSHHLMRLARCSHSLSCWVGTPSILAVRVTERVFSNNMTTFSVSESAPRRLGEA